MHIQTVLPVRHVIREYMCLEKHPYSTGQHAMKHIFIHCNILVLDCLDGLRWLMIVGDGKILRMFERLIG